MCEVSATCVQVLCSRKVILDDSIEALQVYVLTASIIFWDT